MMRFYVDPAWRRPELRHSALLFPFWGIPPMPKTPFLEQLFTQHSFDTSIYTIVSTLSEADAIFLPYPQTIVERTAPELLPLARRVAKESGKPLVVDGASDIEVPLEDALVLRYGGYRFMPKPNEISIPLYAEDLLEHYRGGELALSPYRPRPVVGFSGWAQISLSTLLRALVREWRARLYGPWDSRYRAMKKGIFFRREALALLAASSRVELNALTRATYSGHRETMSKSPELLRQEFVQNLIDSDYGLDVRGDANNSIRLFEILSLGRIPVILDTERNLPFADRVDYASFALIVDFRELPHIADRIADFHTSLTEEAFREMQRKAREAYVQHFRVDAIMRHIVEELRKRGVGSHIK
jgi:hypothetical protein